MLAEKVQLVYFGILFLKGNVPISMNLPAYRTKRKSDFWILRVMAEVRIVVWLCRELIATAHQSQCWMHDITGILYYGNNGNNNIDNHVKASQRCL